MNFYKEGGVRFSAHLLDNALSPYHSSSSLASSLLGSFLWEKRCFEPQKFKLDLIAIYLRTVVWSESAEV